MSYPFRTQVRYIDPYNMRWDWNDADVKQGVAIASIDQLNRAQHKQITSQTAKQKGRTYKGTTYEGLTFPITLVVGDPDWKINKRFGVDWQALASRVNESLDAELTGRLYVITQQGGYRWCDVRCDEFSQSVSTEDPSLSGVAEFTAVLGSDKPWWESFPVELTNPYIPLTGGMFNVVNRGGLESYPNITVTSVAAGAQPKITFPDGSITTFPVMGAAETLTYNSLERSIVDVLGNSVRGRMTVRDQRSPVPAQSNAVMALTMASGTISAITVTIPTLFKGAW